MAINRDARMLPASATSPRHGTPGIRHSRIGGEQSHEEVGNVVMKSRRRALTALIALGATIGISLSVAPGASAYTSGSCGPGTGFRMDAQNLLWPYNFQFTMKSTAAMVGRTSGTYELLSGSPPFYHTGELNKFVKGVNGSIAQNNIWVPPAPGNTLFVHCAVGSDYSYA
ncbi:hypothetical protein ACGFT2_06065 [Streptomyces sp. NPDC048514]|uniref:hypothetical protein n=1 Tax=Streptomyces sp. NPDC048514 TaxID=3365564 RepID=UPI003710E1D6